MELKLQAEDSFVLKVVQLEELLQVRHSVFVIGNAGSGKSQARHPRGRALGLLEGPCMVPAQWSPPQGPQPSASGARKVSWARKEAVGG